MHLGILIENMRREGYEFQVAKPKPIVKEINGELCEPFEYVQVDVPNEYSGGVIELLGHRGGNLETMENSVTQTRLIYTMPSRGLISLTTDFMTCTKGFGTLSHIFLEYRKMENVNIGRHCEIRKAIIDKNVDIPAYAKIGVNREDDIARGFYVSEGGITVVPKGAKL